MRLEFAYVGLAIVFCIVYYLLQKKNVFGSHKHSAVLIRGMKINLVLNIFLAVCCLLSLLVIDGVAYGLEIRYALDFFRFLLRTPDVTTKAMLCMNVALFIMNITTLIVAGSISVKRKGHKNLKLEKTLTSDFVVCAAFSFLSLLELGFSFLTYL